MAAIAAEALAAESGPNINIVEVESLDDVSCSGAAPECVSNNDQSKCVDVAVDEAASGRRKSRALAPPPAVPASRTRPRRAALHPERVLLRVQRCGDCHASCVMEPPRCDSSAASLSSKLAGDASVKHAADALAGAQERGHEHMPTSPCSADRSPCAGVKAGVSGVNDPRHHRRRRRCVERRRQPLGFTQFKALLTKVRSLTICRHRHTCFHQPPSTQTLMLIRGAGAGGC